MHTYQFTVFTSTNPEIVTKVIFRDDEDGHIDKQTIGHMSRGTAVKCTTSFQDFIKQRQQLGTNQFFTFGISKHLEATVVTTKAFPKCPQRLNNLPVVVRNNEHFKFSTKNAILFLDIDISITSTELFTILYKIWPALRNAPHALFPSTSSCIYENDNEVVGINGWHLFVGVTVGTDIPVIGNRLYELLWEAGHARIIQDKAGNLQERTIIDKSVFQSNREVFTCAECLDGLSQRMRRPIILNPDNEPITVSSLPSVEGTYKSLVNQTKSQINNSSPEKDVIIRMGNNKSIASSYTFVIDHTYDEELIFSTKLPDTEGDIFNPTTTFIPMRQPSSCEKGMPHDSVSGFPQRGSRLNLCHKISLEERSLSTA